MKSIKEIAKKAGVSTGTVDRVIHKRSGVSEKTRIKIQKIIDDANFRINPVASSLASKKDYDLAYLIPEVNDSEFWNFPKLGILKGIDEVRSYGVRIKAFEFDQFSVESYKSAFKKMIKYNPTAALIAPVFLEETRELAPELEAKEIPYVFINIEIDGLKNISFLGQKSFESGYLAGKLLYLICAPISSFLILDFRKNIKGYSAIKDRILGFENFFKANTQDVKIIKKSIDASKSETEIIEILQFYFLNTTKDFGVFVPSSKVGLIAKYIEELDLQNIKLIGYDTTPLNIEHLKKDVIHFLIGQKPYEQGYNGVKILSDYLINNNVPKKNYFTSIEIITKENVDYMSS